MKNVLLAERVKMSAKKGARKKAKLGGKPRISCKEKGEEEPLLHKIERINSRILPYALILLALLIFIELILSIENEWIHLLFIVVDYFVIAVFVLDLYFIARHCKSRKYFFKNYWLDILAVFPFFLAFRFFDETYKILSTVSRGLEEQQVLTEGAKLRRGIMVSSRASRFARLGRLAARSLRLFSKGSSLKKNKHRRKLGRRRVGKGVKKGVEQKRVELS